MSITASIIQTTGAPSGAGTVLATQTLSAPTSWTRLTDLDNSVPTGGAVLLVSSDAESFRFAKMDPRSSGDTSSPDTPPPHNGDLVPNFGSGSEGYDHIAYGSQVWVKQA